jgi:hypothetical protein
MNDQTKGTILLKYFLLVTCLTFIAGLTLLSSCEGYSCGEGIIYDNQTKKPLDSVSCKVTGLDIEYSDNLGKYKICTHLAKCVPHCPDITVEFSKKGYKNKIVTNPKDVYLDK